MQLKGVQSDEYVAELAQDDIVIDVTDRCGISLVLKVISNDHYLTLGRDSREVAGLDTQCYLSKLESFFITCR